MSIFNHNKLSIRIFLVLFVPLVCLFILGGWSLAVSLFTQKQIKDIFYRSLDASMNIMQMQRDIIQVQQFLTDISATQGRDKLDDGFIQAAAHFNAFQSGMKRMQELDLPADPTETVQKAESVREKDVVVFPTKLALLQERAISFYAIGIKMANVYITEGVTGGNRIMGEFDHESLLLQGILQSMAEEQRNSVYHNLAITVNKVDSLIYGIIIILVISLLISVGAVVVFTHSILFKLQSMVQLARGVADGNLSLVARKALQTLDHPFIAQDRDEVDILQHTFYQMILTLDSIFVSRTYVNNIIQSMPDILIIISNQGIVERINHPEKLGYTEDEVIGQYINKFFPNNNFLHRSNQNSEAIMLGKDGHQILVMVSGNAMLGAKQEVTGVILIAKDIGSFKVAQQQLQNKDTLLLAAKMADQAKSTFLANMSHEIRTPMTAIIGLTDLALQTQHLPPKAHEYLTIIADSAHFLLRIINDILDFSKIEAGKLEMEKSPFLLQDIFDRLSAMLAVKIVGKDIELIFSFSEECYYHLVGDAIRLEQVLSNLLGNAIKFTHTGEVELCVKTNQWLNDQVTLEFSVRDTGIGINDNQAAKLFQPFIQGDSSISRKYGGTGLGLSICQRLVTMMGGRIWVDTHRGVGSTFFFTATFSSIRTESHGKLMTPDGMAGFKVLVAEKNQNARQVLLNMLENFNFVTTGVGSGHEAVQLVKEAVVQGEPFQMVFIDRAMPEMDGMTTIQKITEQIGEGHFPKIFLLSGRGSEKELLSGGNFGSVSALIFKPVSYTLLFDTIMAVFGKEVTKACHQKNMVRDSSDIVGQIGGARVLLVEDNPVNRLVAQELLSRVGLVVDLAENGQEAIRMMDVFVYDLILMDIQMPEMDGYEATRHIRLQQRFANLPILAMTANVMAEDLERCLAAGMNGHVGKPIDREALLSALLQWIPPREKPMISSVPVQMRESLDIPDSLPGIDVSAALERIDGNQQVFCSLLLEFYRGFSQVGEQIRGALASHDPKNWETANRLAHNVKGMAGNISAMELYYAAQALEMGTCTHLQEGWATLVELFENAINRVLVGIETWIAKDFPSQNNKVVSVALSEEKELLPAIVKLGRLVRDCNVDSAQQLESIKVLLAGQVKAAAHLNRLDESLDCYNFEEAKTALSDLAQLLSLPWDG
ncbi:MAG: response regulator [Magnetococcales bacterium]|nr:response regulator [Magnetococcales bacterium]